MVTEKPILFSSAMVRAILAGQKTQTRRVVSDPRNMIQKIGGSGDADNDPDAFGYFAEGRGFSGWMVLARGVNESVGNNRDRCSIPCPYDADRLWVRETWRPVSASYEGECVRVRWSADGSEATRVTPFSTAERMLRVIDKYPGQWRPSIYCERWASRLLLRVESIRVERLNDLSEEDARAEGCAASVSTIVADDRLKADKMMVLEGGTLVERARSFTFGRSARDRFHDLWQSINGKRPGCSWDENPWVWRVEFSRVTP